jgi:hypothetical protein
MTTVPSSASLLDLQAGAPPLEPNPAQTLSITMKTRKVDPSGNSLSTGGTYTVPYAFGRTAVENNWATLSSGTLPTRIGRTADVNRRSVSSFTYDGSNRLTSFTADGLYTSIQYPSSTEIQVYLGVSGYRITLNALQLVTAIEVI